MIPTRFSFFVPRGRHYACISDRCSFTLVRLAVTGMAGVLTVCLSLFMAATPAPAMEWTAKLNVSMDGGTFIYSGEGPIDESDASKLEKLYASNKRLEGAKSARSVVRLNSPGGLISGGMQLGAVIRTLGLATDVPASAGCYSACTFAFLGGVDRQVGGKFGIHALSLSKDVPSSTTDLDDIQKSASFMVQYARSMVDKSDMAEAALKISASGIALVPDDLLRDWNIITIAIRPSQLYAANEIHTLNCVTGGHTNVTQAVCNGLVLARLDRRISAALAALKRRPTFDRIGIEQQRWSSYRDQCESAFSMIAQGDVVLDRRTGTLGVTDCLSDAYNIRVRELEALVAYFEAGETTVAKKGWKTPAP
jgi:uncharacterized protein